MSENSCRICRGEATRSQPLIHPCKCRGSIKYIHQDCLLEWLKHSNRSTSKCDICNVPYKFRTIYDPDMPEKIPMKFIWEKFVLMISGTMTKVLSVVLYSLCIIVQIPIYWKFIGRIYTWAVDGHLPRANPSFFDALLFGELPLNSTIGAAVMGNVDQALPETMFKAFFYKATKFFEHTYFSGLQYVVIFVVCHVALFIEHEWVVRDEGYNKLLIREVGKEPRVQLLEVLEQAITAMRENEGENLQNLNMMTRALRDLQQNGEQGQFPEEELRRFVEVERNNNNNNNNNNNDDDDNNNNENVNDNVDENEGEDVRDNNENEPQVGNPLVIGGENQDFAFNFGETDLDLLEDGDDEDEGDAGFAPVRRIHVPERNIFGVPRDNIGPNINPMQIVPPFPADDRIHIPMAPVPPVGRFPDEARQLFANDSDGDSDDASDDGFNENLNAFPRNDGPVDDAEDEANGDILDILGVNLNSLRTPIMLMVVGNSIISVYLFVAYLIPLMLGNIISGFIGTLVRIVGNKVAMYSKFSIMQDLVSYKENVPLITNVYFVATTRFVYSKMIQPTLSTIDHLLDLENTYPMAIERVILLLIGYASISLVVYKLMQSIVSDKKEPIVGTPRRIYKILFEVTSTTKVFLIFAIEIFIFPVYCGWLLDFCLAPVFLSRFTDSNSPEILHILVTSALDPSHYLNMSTFAKIIVYWSAGTLYMLFFALYVSMVRDSILRPGVLFFIRSPDDPEARLIHNALVKPFLLQISRIYLCAKVYTAFILVGIGAVTWILRYTVQQPEFNVLLPLQISFDFKSILVYTALAILLNEKEVFVKYSKLYWTYVFELCAHKLRLSHYMLGKLVPQERGYIVYRNVFEHLLARELPDYSKPLSYGAAIRAFKEDSNLVACFVPDGNYVRVPDNDTVSRKYLKKLFVPVTKDDMLLSNAPKTGENRQEQPQANNLVDEFESSDDELTTNNAYTIVYRPPNFKFRCFGLILLLWVFAVILILSIIILGLFLGRPIVRAEQTFVSLMLSTAGAKTISTFDFRLADLKSLLFGLKVQIELLKYWDKRQANAADDGIEDINEIHQEIANGGFGGAIVADAVNFAAALGGGGDNILGRGMHHFTLTVLYSASVFFWMFWIASIHKVCIDIPFRILIGQDKFPEIFSLPMNEFWISKTVIAIHLFVGTFTVLPFCKLQFKRIRDVIAARPHVLDIKQVWKTCIFPILIRFIGTHVLLVAIIMQYRFGIELSPY